MRDTILAATDTNNTSLAASHTDCLAITPMMLPGTLTLR